MKSKLRDTGNHVKPIRVGHAIGELMWDWGGVFRLVPCEEDAGRFAEIYVMNTKGDEVAVEVDADSLRIIQKEAGRLAEWIAEGYER